MLDPDGFHSGAGYSWSKTNGQQTSEPLASPGRHCGITVLVHRQRWEARHREPPTPSAVSALYWEMSCTNQSDVGPHIELIKPLQICWSKNDIGLPFWRGRNVGEGVYGTQHCTRHP